VRTPRVLLFDVFNMSAGWWGQMFIMREAVVLLKAAAENFIVSEIKRAWKRVVREVR